MTANPTDFDDTPSEPDRDPEPEPDTEPDPPVTDHLTKLPDGIGCVEVWEHLSHRRPPTNDTD